MALLYSPREMRGCHKSHFIHAGGVAATVKTAEASHARLTRVYAFNTRSTSPLNVDTVCKTRNRFVGAPCTQGLMALVPPTIFRPMPTYLYGATVYDSVYH